MKRSQFGWIIGGIVAVIIVVVAVVIITRGGNDGSGMAGMDMSHSHESTQSTQPSDNTQAVKADKVTISNFAFSPSAITVKAGTTVTWTNQDGTAHTVTSDDGSAVSFDSGSLSQGKSFTFTFDKAGTYTYHCSFHPEMHGTVVVTS